MFRNYDMVMGSCSHSWNCHAASQKGLVLQGKVALLVSSVGNLLRLHKCNYKHKTWTLLLVAFHKKKSNLQFLWNNLKLKNVTGVQNFCISTKIRVCIGFLNQQNILNFQSNENGMDKNDGSLNLIFCCTAFTDHHCKQAIYLALIEISATANR